MSLDPVVLYSALPPKAIAYLRRLVLQNLNCLQPLTEVAWHEMTGDSLGLHYNTPHYQQLSPEEEIDCQALHDLIVQHQTCLQDQGWNHPQLLALETTIFEQLGYRFDRQACARRYHIVLVDDQPETVQLLSAILRKQGHKVTLLRAMLDVTDKIRELQPDLLVLDVMMPFIDGYTVCQQVKADPELSDIPIVFMSALQNPLDKIKAFRVGGADYLVKPLQYEEVVTRIEHQLHIKRLQDHLVQKNQRFQQEVQEHNHNSRLLELVACAFNQQPDYVLVIAQDGQILYASTSASTYLGYSQAELLKLKFYHLYAPLLPQQMLLIRQTLHQESILTLRQVHHIGKQGDWLPIYLKLFSFQIDHRFYGCAVIRALQKKANPVLTDSVST